MAEEENALLIAGPGSAPVIVMEGILDMLKLLDYENKFCKTKGFKPLNKVYFAVA